MQAYERRMRRFNLTVIVTALIGLAIMISISWPDLTPAQSSAARMLSAAFADSTKTKRSSRLLTLCPDVPCQIPEKAFEHRPEQPFS